MRTLKAVLVAIAVLAVLTGVHTVSFAATNMTLTLFDGITTVQIVDGQPGDQNPVAGAVTFIGSIDNWSVNVSTGQTYPTLGTQSSPQLDLASVNTTSGGPGTLTMWLSATDYFAPGGGAAFNIGGTTAGTVVSSAFYDLTNAQNPFLPGATPLASSSQIGSTLTFSNPPVAFAGSTSGGFSAASNYALAIQTTVTHTGAGTSSFDANVAVPEPGTFLLLGLGLVTFGGMARKKLA